VASPHPDHASSAQRTRPVRVADVPLDVRRRAASEACRHEHDLMEALKIRRLAEHPGDLVAWVRA